MDCIEQELTQTQGMTKDAYVGLTTNVAIIEDSLLQGFNGIIPLMIEPRIHKQIELPPIVNYEHTVAAVTKFHRQSAAEFGLGLQTEYQPLLESGTVNKTYLGSHKGFPDWRFCAFLCSQTQLCRAWTFKYPISRLKPSSPERSPEDWYKYGADSMLRGGCFLKTAMTSPTPVNTTQALAISGAKYFAGMNPSLIDSEHPLRKYFGDVSEELVTYSSGFNSRLAERLELAGCLKTGRMFMSEDYETGSVFNRSLTAVNFDDCLKACQAFPGCQGFDHLSPLELSYRLSPSNANCRLYSSVGRGPDEVWPFAAAVSNLEACEQYIDEDAPSGNLANMDELYPKPFVQGDYLYGVSLRAPLIDSSQGPKYNDIGVNVIIDCRTLAACKEICRRTEACVTFSYNPKSMVCTLLGEPNDLRRDSPSHVVSGFKDGTVPNLSTLIGVESNVIPADTDEVRLYTTCSAMSWSRLWPTTFDPASKQLIVYRAQECLEVCLSLANCVMWFYDPIKFSCYLLDQAPSYYVSIEALEGRQISAMSFCDVSGEPSKNWARHWLSL